METLINYIAKDGDLKLILIVAICVAWRKFEGVEAALNKITETLNRFRTVEECDHRHETCIKRLDTLESDIKSLMQKHN